MRTCKTCGIEKPLTEYHRNKGMPEGRLRHCKTCRKTKTAAEYQANKPKILASQRMYYLANRETILARNARWREHNPDRWIQCCKVTAAGGFARKYGVESTLTVDEWVSIIESYGRQCAYCDGPYEEIEHVIAMSKGGPNTAANVVPSCHDCNQAKRYVPMTPKPPTRERQEPQSTG